MTIARSKIVNPSVTPWYHLISKCVRQAFLLDDSLNLEGLNRKLWVENRLRFLNEVFAISVAGFSVLDNHLHTLIRIDSKEAEAWTPIEVAQRWLKLYPPRDKKRKPIEVTPEYLKDVSKDEAWVEDKRERLASISWFMKCLKEPLSRLANKFDNCKGTFFEGRFKSIAILDSEALLTVCAYIDLNPVAAGIASTPEESKHTSIKERIDHVKSLGRIADLVAANQGSVAARKVTNGLEEDLWLIPIEDRRRIDSLREGLMAGVTLGNYLMLVEQIGRSIREGKVSISSEISDVFERIGTSPSRLQQRIHKLSIGRFYGSFMASNHESLTDVAARFGVHHLVNLCK